MTANDLNTKIFPNWCPGCGNFGIWAAFKNAAVAQNWDNTNTVIVAGIGCHSHIINFVNLTAFEGLHGRALPVATGIKLANHKLNVFVFTGDGDCLGEGGNHFIHACRRNINLTILLHDNAVYGLTTGQTSPTSPCSYTSRSTPGGNIDSPLNPIALAIASGATFVARAYSTDIKSLSQILIDANNHDGLAVVDIMQPCVTFNKDYTHNFFQTSSYQLGEDYDPTNKIKALEKSFEWAGDNSKIPLGIIYKENRPSYESQLPQLKNGPLVSVPATKRDISSLFRV
ncbi:hypothetical protein A2872_03450 [Candidatus Gottesmanbacteria bacterium RIFCSPHIGHO2_01_FULL_42_12]|uniref:2-oxoacid ferredoxin oxidoreductase n=1 Tax=Candidatus Gottesmanbacteria bacterium RIFCSPHIGHO2_01_FULL_42_12 TaxID=1798377 RepID=A0A1F5Z4Q6_9BACT|nr:MAG: hypothetical protein A2872_03450 [Candidatus Gottesmanbacteria bacterium RIFCSPHIGHO2_01_FULL_42_12]